TEALEPDARAEPDEDVAETRGGKARAKRGRADIRFAVIPLDEILVGHRLAEHVLARAAAINPAVAKTCDEERLALRDAAVREKARCRRRADAARDLCGRVRGHEVHQIASSLS